MFNGFIMPATSAGVGRKNSVSLKDRIYGVGFTPNEPIKLTEIAGHKVTSARVVNITQVDKLGNPFTKPVVEVHLENTSGYGLRTYWSNAPAGTKVTERDLDISKLVEFTASQDGIVHTDNSGDPIYYASDEAPKARISEE